MENLKEYVTLAEKGVVSVPAISEMSEYEIDNEISSYTREDLLNNDTLDRLGRLRIESTPMVAMRIRAQKAVEKRVLERKNRLKEKEIKEWLCNSYWIKRLTLNVARPPIKSMSYDQASRWIASQPSGTQMYYQVELSSIKNQVPA